jgi:hypothetical protein
MRFRFPCRPRRSFTGWVGDDAAQAITEFALIIPLLLLFFFSLLQGLMIAQVAHLGNYAAYAAARTYAVRSGVSGLDGDAEDYAKKAAALVYAPVSRLVPNEVAVVPGIASLITGALPEFLQGAARVAEGFVTAYYVRMGSIGGGSFNVSRSGSPEEVKVEIEYAYPIFMPGLAETWSLVAGERNIKTHLDDMGVSDSVGLAGLVSPFPYIKIKSKCSMGYEPWNGNPRKPKTVSSEAAVNEDLAEQQQEMQEAQEALEDAQQKESEEYGEFCAAKAAADAACAYAAAHPDDDDAQADCQAKTEKKNEEYQEYLNARAERIAACEHLADVSGQSLECGGDPGNCD